MTFATKEQARQVITELQGKVLVAGHSKKAYLVQVIFFVLKHSPGTTLYRRYDTPSTNT